MKCPECSQDISYLEDHPPVGTIFELSINEEGEPQYDEVGTGGDDEYKCPECGEVLFTNEEEAIKFLKT